MKLNIGIILLVVNVLCLIYKLFFKDKITVKTKKIIKIIVAVIIIFCLIFAIIFDTHYAVINKKIYRNDITKIKDNDITQKEDTDYFNTIDFDVTSVREVNKCTELEEMELKWARENTISKLKDFPNLRYLKIFVSWISSADIEKISSFNLERLRIDSCNIDFTGFNSDTISCLELMFGGNNTNFEVLSECKSLKKIIIVCTTISDNYIIREYFGNFDYVMIDSSVFSSFDYVESLELYIDRIEDISGILEMDSLKELKVPENAVSEDNIKLLEDKGISVTYYDY